jgi:GntR family transcriptional regulator, rspAB operon transcriptional repressor
MSLPRSLQRPLRPGGVMRPARSETVAKVLYRELKAEIVSMRRKPGEPIIEREIASRYGVSRTPVREAILRLADEALVDIFPQSGTFVGKIPLGSLPEAILVRKALEQLTAQLAAEAATREQVQELQQLLEIQRRTQRAGNRDGFHEADEAFHAKIAEIAGHPGIWTLVQQVKVQVDRYRRLTLPVPGRMARVLQEHAAVVKAIEARDPARAASAMTRHLDGLSASIADVRDLNPQYFIDDLESPTSTGS